MGLFTKKKKEPENLIVLPSIKQSIEDFKRKYTGEINEYLVDALQKRLITLANQRHEANYTNRKQLLAELMTINDYIKGLRDGLPKKAMKAAPGEKEFKENEKKIKELEDQLPYLKRKFRRLS